MRVKADLHIHTVLSPCGDLDMSPGNILRAALERGLGLIGITDHNSTRQALLIQEWGREMGVAVLAGAEVTTAEEAHCLAFFPTPERLAARMDARGLSSAAKKLKRGGGPQLPDGTYYLFEEGRYENGLQITLPAGREKTT